MNASLFRILNNNSKSIIIFIIGFLLLAALVIGLNYLFKFFKNIFEKKKMNIFYNYKRLKPGMTKEQIKELFKGLRPRVRIGDVICYQYLYTNTLNSEEGERLELYFDNNGRLCNWKVYAISRSYV